MTDHLDEAAAKAVDLAAELTQVGMSERVAAHLMYVAGLLRGSGVRAVLPGRCDATTLQYGCHLNAGHTGQHMHSDGTRWSGDAERELVKLREVSKFNEQEWRTLRTQRDELLTAAKDAVSVAEDLVPGLVLDRLREAIERAEQES